ncbi:MAG: hypothetical protein HQK50_06585 [Oligoflexia bacterium]|nr:hypothetical protein [Oligoflexia bacterium]MBF0365219.1 hypothetical protein [Oligoflexia bacterium]
MLQFIIETFVYFSLLFILYYGYHIFWGQHENPDHKLQKKDEIAKENLFELPQKDSKKILDELNSPKIRRQLIEKEKEKEEEEDSIEEDGDENPEQGDEEMTSKENIEPEVDPYIQEQELEWLRERNLQKQQAKNNNEYNEEENL